MTRSLRLSAWFVCALVLGWLCSRADLGGSLTALLPDDDSRLGRDVRFFATQRAAQMIALEAWRESSNGASPGDPVAELHRVAAAGEAVGLHPLGDDGPEALGRLERVLYDRLPLLLPTGTLDEIADRLDGDGLREHLAALRARASDPTDIMTATAAQGDLLGLAGKVLIPLRDHLGASAAASQGVIHHADGIHHILLAEVGFPPDDSAHTHDLMEALDAATADAATRGVHFEVIGSHRHFRDNLDGLRADLLTSLPVGMLLIAVVLWTLVRSPAALLALHIPAVFAALGAIASLVITGNPVPTLLIGFASGFLGVSIENALHITVALQHGEADHVRRPLIIGYLTTAVAFAVLMASAIAALRNLGIMVMGGLILALVSSLWLLPDLIRRQPRPATWPGPTRWILSITQLPVRTRLVVLAVISIALLPGLTRLRVIDDLRKMDGSRPETITALTNFLSRWDHFETSDFLVAHAPTPEAALEAFAAARVQIGQEPTLVDLLLPPPAEQARRLATWNQFWSEHSDQFQTGLRAALSERGFAATTLTRERYQPRDHIDPVGFTTWNGTPFARIVEQLVTEDAGQTRIAAPLPDARDLATVEAAAQTLQDNPQAWIASRGQLAGDLVNLVSHDLVRLSGWMALAMALLVWILERSLRAVIAILIPPTLALAWCFGLLGWIGVPLSPFSVMVAAFIAGIGLDNAVFLARIEHRASAIAPVLACTITTMLGVGSLIIANNPILRQNGIALSSGLACCLIACVLLTPLLMDRHPPTKAEPES